MATATLPSFGYSGKSLPDKLGYKPGMVAAFIALPEELAALAKAVPFGKVAQRGDWAKPLPAATFDLIHAFTISHTEIVHYLPKLQRALKPNGMLWVSWPKRAARVATDVTEDIIRNEALKLDLVDVKVAAVDEKWSGLKLVIRVDRR